MTLKKQDDHFPLVKLADGTEVPSYDPMIAFRILERLAAGETLTSITKDPNMPSLGTWYRWTMLVPDLATAARNARELSAQSMEEKALDLGRELAANPGNTQRVRAFDVYMNQLRWSASRRDPTRYSEKTAISVKVPIQINTGLAIGEVKDGGQQKNFYSVTAMIQQEPEDAEFTEVEPKALTAPPKQDMKVPRPPVRGEKGVPLKRVLIPRNPLWSAANKGEKDASKSSIPQRGDRGVPSPSSEAGDSAQASEQSREAPSK